METRNRENIIGINVTNVGEKARQESKIFYKVSPSAIKG